MEAGECDWSKSAWTGRMSTKSRVWPQGRVRAMRQSSLIPSSPSEERVPDTVCLRLSALFRNELRWRREVRTRSVAGGKGCAARHLTRLCVVGLHEP